MIFILSLTDQIKICLYRTFTISIFSFFVFLLSNTHSGTGDQLIDPS